jgi:hypothetical protein
MALDAERIKTVASWGFLGIPGGTLIIEGPVEITLTDLALLEVTLEADEITVELDDG